MDKRRKIFIGVGTVAALGVLWFVYSAWAYVKTDNAQIEAHTVLLAAKVSGYVKKVNAVEGQHVNEGDILVEIDDRDFQNALKQFQGELAGLEARKNDAERTYGRISDLYKKEAVSQQQYDQASAAYRELKSRYEGIGAQVAQAELNISNTKVRAPYSGFVARKSVESGQLASPGAPLIGFVGDRERWVVANFKETDLSGIRIGARADISVDAIKSGDFHGTVESISAATGSTFTLLPPDNATGNFTKVVQRVPVKIKLESLTPEDIEHLRAGLSADVRVHKH